MLFPVPNGRLRGRLASAAQAYNPPMSTSPLNALSPLDGRYAGKLNNLRPLMSEQGYMHRRVQVEVAWFIALSDAKFAEFKPLSPGARTMQLSSGVCPMSPRFLPNRAILLLLSPNAESRRARTWASMPSDARS